jgi:phage gp16-like protein
MSRATPETIRTRELAAIHASKKQLGLDDDAYRDLLQSVTGQRSAKGLDAAQRREVLDRMKQRGGARPRSTPVGQHPGKPHNLSREPMLQKIEALLAELKAPWSYADGIARRMFKVQRVAWLRKEDQKRAVIAALDYELRKRATLEAIDRAMRELGMSEEALRQQVPTLPNNWRNVKRWRIAIADLLGASAELLREQEAAE